MCCNPSSYSIVSDLCMQGESLGPLMRQESGCRNVLKGAVMQDGMMEECSFFPCTAGCCGLHKNMCSERYHTRGGKSGWRCST
jgi:hypothetical protein